MRVKFEAAVRRAQDDICKAVSDMDGKQFHEDAWTRPGGGGGVSRVLQVCLQALYMTACSTCVSVECQADYFILCIYVKV